MNTSAINNPLSIQPATPNGKQTSDTASDPGAFSQTLSAISNRSDSSKANNNDTNKNVTKNGDNDGSKTTGKDETKTTDKGKPTTAADKKTDSKDKSKDKDSDKTTDNAAAGIMAFVANLTQNHKVTAGSATDAKLSISDKLKAGADKAVDASKAGIAAAADDKGKTGKQTDFLSALEKAAVTDSKGGKATVTTQATETFAPLLATSSQTMAPNSTALQRANELQTMQANTFSQQVGSADWDKALGQKVVWMVQGAQTSATMTLNPPDLGPMQITLNVNNNQATANFVAQHPDVRHALENAMPRLREMLGDAGIQLGQSNVSAGNSDQQAAFENGRQGLGRSSSSADISSNAPALHVSHVRTPIASDGMVDTFV